MSLISKLFQKNKFLKIEALKIVWKVAWSMHDVYLISSEFVSNVFKRYTHPTSFNKQQIATEMGTHACFYNILNNTYICDHWLSLL